MAGSMVVTLEEETEWSLFRPPETQNSSGQ